MKACNLALAIGLEVFGGAALLLLSCLLLFNPPNNDFKSGFCPFAYPFFTLSNCLLNLSFKAPSMWCRIGLLTLLVVLCFRITVLPFGSNSSISSSVDSSVYVYSEEASLSVASTHSAVPVGAAAGVAYCFGG